MLRVTKVNYKMNPLINPELFFLSFTNPEVRKGEEEKHSKMGKATGKDDITG